MRRFARQRLGFDDSVELERVPAVSMTMDEIHLTHSLVELMTPSALLVQGAGTY